jgi:hypothetical protein
MTEVIPALAVEPLHDSGCIAADVVPGLQSRNLASFSGQRWCKTLKPTMALSRIGSLSHVANAKPSANVKPMLKTQGQKKRHENFLELIDERQCKSSQALHLSP